MSLLRNGRTALTLPYVETMNFIVSLQSLNALFLETMRFIVSTTLAALCLLQDFMLALSEGRMCVVISWRWSDRIPINVL